MKRTAFRVDGDIYSRGEKAFSYKAGEKVAILREINDENVEILVLEGEASGEVMPAEKNLLEA